jgi:pimeloyl-ACP methyl ester carboxylesterase
MAARMTFSTSPLSVMCDGLELPGGSCLPRRPRGGAALLHGMPSIAPPEPGDEGYAGLAARFAARSWAALWTDMRAARGSPGWFTIEGWVRDARAVVDAVRALPLLDGLPVALVGSSAGGAVAVEAARRGAPVDALVLLAAPAGWISFAADAPAAVRRITEEAGMAVAPEVLADPASWAAEFAGVVPEQAIAGVDVPTLVVHGDRDDVVPVDHALRIAAAGRRVDLRLVPGADHRLRLRTDVVDMVLDWLDETL